MSSRSTNGLFERLVIVVTSFSSWSFRAARCGENMESLNASSSSQIADDPFVTYKSIARYYVAFLVVFGSIGNATCLIIYRRASLKRCRRVQYLTALAASDLVFLFCLGLMSLKGVGVEWQEMPGICSASIYISNTACFLSGWYVMVLTAEMACVLRRPYHIVRTTAGSRLNVAKRIAGVSLLGCLLNSWTLFVTESVPKSSLAIPPQTDTEYYYYDEDTSDSSNSTTTNFTSPMIENYTYGGFESSMEPYYDPMILTTASSSSPTDTIRQTAPSGYICRIGLNSQILYDTFTVIDTIASFSVPLVVTLVLNLYIGVTITKAARERRFMSQHQILARLRARAQCHAGGGAIENNAISHSTAGHPPLSKKDSGNNNSIGFTPPSSLPPGILRSALKHRESRESAGGGTTTATAGGRVLSEMTTRLRRLALKQRLRAEATVSSLLVAKSLTYLMLNLPNYVHRVCWALKRDGAGGNGGGGGGGGVGAQRGKTDTEFLLQMIVYLMLYTQYALNFVIYSSNAFVRNVCKGRRSRSSSLVLK